MIEVASGMPGNIVYAISGIPNSASQCAQVVYICLTFLRLPIYGIIVVSF